MRNIETALKNTNLTVSPLFLFAKQLVAVDAAEDPVAPAVDADADADADAAEDPVAAAVDADAVAAEDPVAAAVDIDVNADTINVVVVVVVVILNKGVSHFCP